MGTVTFSGKEIAWIAGAIAHAMPAHPADFEMFDILLERSLAGMSGLDPEVLAALEQRRAEAREAHARLRGEG